MTPVVVLGVTGSIGRQTLEVCDRLGRPVVAIAAGRGSNDLHAIATARPEVRVAVAAPTGDERERFTADLGERVSFGSEAVAELAAIPDATVVNAIVGAAGLRASAIALESGNRLALANKESLVSAGTVLLDAAARGGGELIPIDSEHSALFQLLDGEDADSVSRLVLTASGGPFRGRPLEDLEEVTVEEALDHPTWSMGPRITIDSATLMNKAFEVIEAHHLFGVSYDRIGVVIHPQSIVHGLVEFSDGSYQAHLGAPDMRVPIAYALGHPQRLAFDPKPFSLAGAVLEFLEPDLDQLPCLRLGYEAGRSGGSAPAVLNAADEMAVRAFLERRIGFTSIPVVVERTLADVEQRELATVDDVLSVDAEARSVAAMHIGIC
ncbi:MAG: 1-deoxy-D-xylulose-5-phosphate reductoisomerase [Acidimicrobiia bacterium]